MTPSLWPAVLYACAIAVVNGFGRFAYGLLLPVMRADLGWDYVQSGWLNTANAVGYGVGALLGLVLSARWRASALFQAGLAATVVTLAACAYTRDLGWMLDDLDYSNPHDIRPNFVRVELVNGVLDVTAAREARGAP